ncbi:hypothetical protein J6590_045213 [Homalodisca vitripennis]|nr:hypothetical protein J6590_045213 [Homalodisca vitripennis]
MEVATTSGKEKWAEKSTTSSSVQLIYSHQTLYRWTYRMVHYWIRDNYWGLLFIMMNMEVATTSGKEKWAEKSTTSSSVQLIYSHQTLYRWTCQRVHYWIRDNY